MADCGKILVVDDDDNIISLLSVNLGNEGYEVVIRRSALEVEANDFVDVRLIFADAMDCSYSGLDLLQAVKCSPETANIPFIVCSVCDSERVIIEALDAGADDYIVKPFSIRELVARAKAVIRRHGMMAARSEIKHNAVLQFHSLSLDLTTRRVTDGDQLLSLTKTEFAILELLLKQLGNYVSRTTIYKPVWRDDVDKTNDRIVDTNISRLRKKLGPLGSHLVNRSGLGYMMRT